jgi:hypothetical protein
MVFMLFSGYKYNFQNICILFEHREDSIEHCIVLNPPFRSRLCDVIGPTFRKPRSPPVPLAAATAAALPRFVRSRDLASDIVSVLRKHHRDQLTALHRRRAGPKPSGPRSVVNAYDLGSRTVLAVIAISTPDTERAKPPFSPKHKTKGFRPNKNDTLT